MKWNKSARLLAVASLALASSVAWGQVNIGGASGKNPIGSVTAPGVINTTVTPNTYGGALPTINGGAGVSNPAATSLTKTGGAGGASGTVDAYSATPSTTGPRSAYDTTGAIPVVIGGTGLAGTSHDFASGTASTGVANGAGLCTFCHTPHKAKSTLLLWNHTLSSNTFQWDVAATTSGTALPGFAGNAYNGPSAKCLSCHDGSVAIGDVGWFAEGAKTLPSTSTSFTTGKIDQTNTKSVGYGGNMSGNHPVAIPYPLNGAPNVYNGSTTGAQLATNDFVADPTGNNIRLYSDVGGGAIIGKTTAGQTGIECSSCHDPHNKAAKDDFFLRGNLAGSSQADGYICLQCHTK